MGWDSSFHSLRASVTVTSGHLPSWTPYERMPINYPYGPHTFIAEISLVTGVAPDRVFAAHISGVFPVLPCLALYALALRLLRGNGHALAAVAAYGLLGYWGSVNYAVWGGLPNEISCFLALAFFAVLFTPNATWRHIIAGGLILGAIALAHHHVMLTVALLLALFAVACSSITQQFDSGASQLAAGEAQEFAWVRAHTPADTVALNVDATAHWASYFTGRESAITPIPTSEFAGGYAAEKRYLSSVLWTLLQRPPTTQVIAAGTGTALPALLGRPVAVLTTRSPAGLVGSLAFASGDQRVFLLANGYGRLRPVAQAGSIRWWTGATSAPPESWRTAGAETGWSDDPSRATRQSVAYLRVMTPLPANAKISCHAQGSADLWLDGRPISQACDGAIHPLPSGPGAHTLALRVRWSPGQQPWSYLFVVAEAAS
jgi:hypothetical protein